MEPGFKACFPRGCQPVSQHPSPVKQKAPTKTHTVMCLLPDITHIPPSSKVSEDGPRKRSLHLLGPRHAPRYPVTRPVAYIPMQSDGDADVEAPASSRVSWHCSGISKLKAS